MSHILDYHKGAIPLLSECHYKFKHIPTRSLLQNRDLFPYQYQPNTERALYAEATWKETHLKKSTYETVDANRSNKWLRNR
jgi:hypothetical protein